MSSTRKSSKTRDPFDYYPTPGWCVERFLEKANIPYTPQALWLEPAAGDGAIIKAVGNHYTVKKNGVMTVMQYKPVWIAVEIQPRFQHSLERELYPSHVLIDDFLTMDAEKLGAAPQVVLTNPPFSLALSFIKKSMELKAEYICMLLRLNFLGSHERSSFMREHTPDIYVLPNRPSFTGKGTDSIEYAWFVWRKENDYGAPNLSLHQKINSVALDTSADIDRCNECKHSISHGSLTPAVKFPHPRLVILDDTPSENR